MADIRGAFSDGLKQITGTEVDGKNAVDVNIAAGDVQVGAGENHIGEVSSNTAVLTPTITVSTDAYAQYDCIGGKITLTDAMRVNGGTAILQSLLLLERSTTPVKANLELLIFSADPSASTLTDQAAVSIHANDMAKLIRRISISSADYVMLSASGPSIADIVPGSRILKSAAASKDLYMAIMATGAHDYVAGTDLSIRLGLIRD